MSYVEPPKTETTFEPMGRGGRCGEGPREGATEPASDLRAAAWLI